MDEQELPRQKKWYVCAVVLIGIPGKGTLLAKGDSLLAVGPEGHLKPGQDSPAPGPTLQHPCVYETLQHRHLPLSPKEILCKSLAS